MTKPSWKKMQRENCILFIHSVKFYLQAGLSLYVILVLKRELQELESPDDYCFKGAHPEQTQLHLSPPR
jgi:hypothetical protein